LLESTTIASPLLLCCKDASLYMNQQGMV